MSKTVIVIGLEKKGSLMDKDKEYEVSKEAAKVLIKGKFAKAKVSKD